MLKPEWCRECFFYYNGMTPEDYIYLQYCIRKNKLAKMINDLQRGDIRISPEKDRTKEEVFSLFKADLNYIFDINEMC